MIWYDFDLNDLFLLSHYWCNKHWLTYLPKLPFYYSLPPLSATLSTFLVTVKANTTKSAVSEVTTLPLSLPPLSPLSLSPFSPPSPPSSPALSYPHPLTPVTHPPLSLLPPPPTPSPPLTPLQSPGDSGLSAHGLAYAKKLAEFVESHIVRDPPNPHSHAASTTTITDSTIIDTTNINNNNNNNTNANNSKKLLCSSINTGGPSSSSSHDAEIPARLWTSNMTRTKVVCSVIRIEHSFLLLSYFGI